MKGLRLISTPLQAAKQSPHFAINISGANRQGRAEDFALKFVLP